ncbi:MAG: MBOAT family O-acyltransferase [Bacteroidota bacterium]
MLFNSLVFLVFIAVFFPLFFATRGLVRIAICLVASYVFYGWWDWRFLSLIALSTVVDYTLGLALDKEERERRRKTLLTLSIVMNLGLLAVFKYFNFFIDSFQDAISIFGITDSLVELRIILPVGISFYTFQTMSYSIDLYRRKIEVERNFLRFATYVAFFPQLVAGPIVRASHLLPQFRRDQPFVWNAFLSGLGLVLVGYFKKVVVADSLAPVVDTAFGNPEAMTALGMLIGVFFYAFQIYCDFSGYSDIAIGLARMLGYDFGLNFRTPYFSRSFSEFWQRWHISLSSWLRDYLYISLGGNRKGVAKTYRNLMLTMLLGGLWHGASWTFVFWGWLHGMYLIVQRLIGETYAKGVERAGIPAWIKDGVAMLTVFLFTCLAWVFFRSPDFATAMTVLTQIGGMENLSFAAVTNKVLVLKGFVLISVLLVGEVLALRTPMTEQVLAQPAWRVVGFAALLWAIALLGNFTGGQFIYFQF